MPARPVHSTARRQRCRPAPGAYPPIESFVDACAEAFALHEQFGRGDTAFLLDDAGRVLGGWTLTLPTTDVTSAASMLLGSQPMPGATALLFTLRGDDEVTDEVPADDEMWERLRAELASRGVPLRDWIIVGGERLRSMAFATDADTAWL